MNQDLEQQSSATEAAPTPGSRKIKKILLLAIMILLLGAGGGLAYLMFTDDPYPVESSTRTAPASYPERAIMPLEPFLVNLADRDSRRYLKLKVELEVDQGKAVKELEKVLPPIRDVLILLLSSKTYAEISSVEGKQQLKQDIMQKLAAVPGGNHVKGIYFTEFVAQ